MTTSRWIAPDGAPEIQEQQICADLRVWQGIPVICTEPKWHVGPHTAATVDTSEACEPMCTWSDVEATIYDAA